MSTLPELVEKGKTDNKSCLLLQTMMVKLFLLRRSLNLPFSIY
jgi:hypothetical protein